jgi:hypothetical protein
MGAGKGCDGGGIARVLIVLPSPRECGDTKLVLGLHLHCNPTTRAERPTKRICT